MESNNVMTVQYPIINRIVYSTISPILSIGYNPNPILSIGYNFSEKEEDIITMAESFIRKILKDINNAKDNFSELEKRKIFFYQIKEDLYTLWDFVTTNDCSENLVVLLIDSMNNLTPEDIKPEQLDSIKDVIESIWREHVTEDKLDLYIDYLIEKDIPVVRLPEDLSSLYD